MQTKQTNKKLHSCRIIALTDDIRDTSKPPICLSLRSLKVKIYWTPMTLLYVICVHSQVVLSAQAVAIYIMYMPLIPLKHQSIQIYRLQKWSILWAFIPNCSTGTHKSWMSYACHMLSIHCWTSQMCCTFSHRRHCWQTKLWIWFDWLSIFLLSLLESGNNFDVS